MQKMLGSVGIAQISRRNSGGNRTHWLWIDWDTSTKEARKDLPVIVVVVTPVE